MKDLFPNRPHEKVRIIGALKEVDGVRGYCISSSRRRGEETRKLSDDNTMANQKAKARCLLSPPPKEDSGYVFTTVCLSVCLSVSRISFKKLWIDLDSSLRTGYVCDKDE